MQTVYNVRHLDLDARRRLCERAKDLCEYWWADVLDCSKSFRRQRVEMPWEDILGKLDAQTHFVAIRRDFFDPPVFEIGFSTMRSPDYFLWIHVALSKMHILTDEFGMKVLY